MIKEVSYRRVAALGEKYKRLVDAQRGIPLKKAGVVVSDIENFSKIEAYDSLLKKTSHELHNANLEILSSRVSTESLVAAEKAVYFLKMKKYYTSKYNKYAGAQLAAKAGA